MRAPPKPVTETWFVPTEISKNPLPAARPRFPSSEEVLGEALVRGISRTPSRGREDLRGAMGRIEGNVKEANASSSGDVEDLGGDATGHDA